MNIMYISIDGFCLLIVYVIVTDIHVDKYYGKPS